MKKWLAGILVWLLQGLSDAEQGPVLDGCRCTRCQNYFWVTEAELEPPHFCPYCGVQFSGHRPVSGADFGDLGN